MENKRNNEMKETYKLMNRLIKENKIKFSFYNNNQVPLELLQLCHNKKDDTIELEFRNVMSEYLEELKSIINTNIEE